MFFLFCFTQKNKHLVSLSSINKTTFLCKRLYSSFDQTLDNFERFRFDMEYFRNCSFVCFVLCLCTQKNNYLLSFRFVNKQNVFSGNVFSYFDQKLTALSVSIGFFRYQISWISRLPYQPTFMNVSFS